MPPDRGVSVGHRQRHLQPHENDRQQVVEVMGNAAGQTTDRLQLLRLLQLHQQPLPLLLGLLALGDVLHDSRQAHGVVMFAVFHLACFSPERAHALIRPDDTELDRMCLSVLKHCTIHGIEGSVVIRMDNLRHRIEQVAGECGAIQPKDCVECVGPLHSLHVGIPGPTAEPCYGLRLVQIVGGGPQRCNKTFVLSDIGDDAKQCRGVSGLVIQGTCA